MVKGIDCAIPLTTAQAKALAAAGYMFAARYLVPSEYKWKRLTRAEAEAITAAGMKLVSVYESTASRPQGGAAAGKIDGAAALKEAKAIGQPLGSVIYFAVDYDAAPKDFVSIANYLIAAAEQITGYKLGVYGSYAVVEEMAKRKAAAAFWQTYAWSRGKKSEYANIYQYMNDTKVAGIALDLNESYGGEGFWDTKPVATPVPEKPVAVDIVPKVVKGDKLITTGELVDGKLIALVADVLKALGIPYHWDNETKKLYV